MKSIEGVKVFRVCECDAVAAYSYDDARAWYQDVTGVEDDFLYSKEEVSEIALDTEINEGEESDNKISVRSVVEEHWEGEPFIAVTTGGY